jgi:hypothetical protein
MRYPTEFSDSFNDNIRALKPYEEQVVAIIRCLEGDPYYEPPKEDYNTEWNKHHDFAVCQHIRGWRGYKLGWYFEYLKNTGAMIVKIVLLISPPPNDRPDDYVTLLPLSPDSRSAANFDI